MSQFMFVVSSSKEAKSTQRDHELARAAALSHAARVSHQRRKEKEASRWLEKGERVAATAADLADDPASNSGEPLTAVVQTRGSRAEDEHEEEVWENIGPLTLLRRGNSDTFQSLAIAVTLRVNEILSFFKNSFLPAIYQSDPEKHYISFSADSAWDIHRSTLCTECSAQSFLLNGLIIMGNVATHDGLEMEKLVLKGKLFKRLQDRIQTHPEGDQAVLDSIMFLFSSEIFDGDLSQATIHGKVLRTLLRKKFKKMATSSIGLVEQSILSHALYYDSHLSLSSMCPPIFALDKWVGDVLDPIFRPLDEYLEPLQSAFVSGLDGSLDSEPLRSIFIQARLEVWLWTQPKPIIDHDRGAMSLWLMGRTHLYKAMLVKHYLNLKSLLQEIHRSPTSSTGEEIPLLSQSSLALGLLLFFTSIGGDPNIAGHPLLRIHKTLLTHLQVTMSFIAESFHVSSQLMHKYQNAHLWVLFLGAQAERRGPKLVPDVSKAWFNVTFGSLARRMGLSTWPMVRERLTAFWYSDYIAPNGSTWVSECLGKGH